MEFMSQWLGQSAPPQRAPALSALGACVENAAAPQDQGSVRHERSYSFHRLCFPIPTVLPTSYWTV